MTNTFNTYKLVGTNNEQAEFCLRDKVLVAKYNKTTKILRFFEMTLSFPLKPELIWETTPVLEQEDVGDCKIAKTRNSTYIFKRMYQCQKNWFIPVSDTGIRVRDAFTYSDGTTVEYLEDRVKTMLCFDDRLQVRAKYCTHPDDDGNDIFLPEAEIIQFIAGGKGLTCELDPDAFLAIMSRFSQYYSDDDFAFSSLHPINFIIGEVNECACYYEHMDLSRI